MGLRLADGVTVTRAGSVILFEVGDDDLVIDSEPVAACVERLVPLLDGTADRAALIGGQDAAFVDDLVDTLVECGVVRDDRTAGLVDATVLVAGVTPWAARCAEALRAAGVGAVLPATGPVSGARLVVDAMDSGDEDRHRALAAACWEAGVPSIAGHPDRRRFVVGPLTRPPAAGCWLCAHRRHVATRPPEIAGIAARARVLARLPIRPTDLDLTGDLLAAAAHAFLSGTADTLLAGQVDIHGPGGRTRHTVVPLAGCPVCGSGNRSPFTGDPWPDGTVDPDFGIVRELDEYTAGPLHTALAKCSLPLDRDGLPVRQRAECARGVGPTAAEARLRAVGEAVERHVAAATDDTGVVWATGQELPDRFLPPSALTHYLPDQYAWLPFRLPDDTEPTAWWPGSDPAGERVWLPAAALRLYRPPRECYAQVTSNGLAGGRGFADAAVRAVCELVERDAVLTAWYARRPCQRLGTGGLSDADRGVLDWLRRLGYRIACYVLPAALPIATVLAVAFGDGRRTPGAVVGAATDPDAAAAASRALWELASNCDLGIAELRDTAGAHIAHAADVHTVDDHAVYYRPADRQEAFAFLDGAGTVDVRELPVADPTLDGLAMSSAGSGVRLYLAELSATVVRAVSPDLVPLWFGTGNEPRAHPRLHWRDGQVPHPFS